MGKLTYLSLKLDRSQLMRLAVLLVMVAAITASHYLTATHHSSVHDIYRRLYYVPIVLGGLWFSLRGGVGTSLLVSLLYAPHVLFQWGHLPTSHLEQYLEILLYNTIGFLTGFLASKEHSQRLRAEKAAQRLTASYDKLRQQADLILEIEDQLRRADRLTALGELSAGMAHEIRNPLGSIRGTAEILRDAFPPENRYAEFSQILISEVDRLNKVLEDFLSFARPQNNEKNDFRPDQVLQEVLQLTQQPALKKQIAIHWEQQSLPAAIGDAAQFKQVFLNLVLNALQAMSSGGQLWIRTAVGQEQIEMAFQDTGPGIPDEYLDKVFNPFFTTKDEGTGLGLAITHRIVRNHYGQISVACPPEGGTVFTLKLQTADCRPAVEES